MVAPQQRHERKKPRSAAALQAIRHFPTWFCGEASPRLFCAKKWLSPGCDGTIRSGERDVHPGRVTSTTVEMLSSLCAPSGALGTVRGHSLGGLSS